MEAKLIVYVQLMPSDYFYEHHYDIVESFNVPLKYCENTNSDTYIQIMYCPLEKRLNSIILLQLKTANAIKAFLETEKRRMPSCHFYIEMINQNSIINEFQLDDNITIKELTILGDGLSAIVI